MVTMCDVGMMARFFMATAGLVLGSFFMMAGRMFMVLSSFCVVVCTLLAHISQRSPEKNVRGRMPAVKQ